MSRNAVIDRKTAETNIHASLNLDGSGKMDISTGIGFFDHMLSQTIRHGFFDLELKAGGDLNVDCHHTVEDTGIVLGMAFAKALGDKKGIGRYGFFIVPMDEALALCAMDFSGRPYLSFDAAFSQPKVGALDTEMVEEFFRAFSVHAGCNLHFKLISGQNNHHIAEALFKAFGKALDQAVSFDIRVKGALSTKGVL
jgi:imidazoleglycerol-phosphate dehydratase